jgi:hypothetical protein
VAAIEILRNHLTEPIDRIVRIPIRQHPVLGADRNRCFALYALASQSEQEISNVMMAIRLLRRFGDISRETHDVEGLNGGFACLGAFGWLLGLECLHLAPPKPETLGKSEFDDRDL